MGFSIFGRVGTLAFPVGIVLAAGCSSAAPPPRAYVAASLTSNSGSCTGVGGTQPILTIGTFETGSPVRVNNGGPIHITCTVGGSDPNFTVELSAVSDSTVPGSGGSISITGGGISVANGATGLSATFVGVTYGAYEGTNCTMNYSYDGVANVGGVAAGRIWGHIDCPAATSNSSTTGTGTPSTCDAAADFVFENCGT